MKGKVFFVIASGLSLAFALSAAAEEASGRTADGCTYKVINGQYLTSCAKGSRATPAPARPAPAAPVTDYGSVPVYRNAAAAAPALPPQQPSVSYASSAGVSSIERDDAAFDLNNDDLKRAHLHNKLVDQTYVGVELGASNMKESNAGSSTGFGLEIGTNIDDTFGVELGYSYSKQDLSLGLASRGTIDDGSNDNKMNTDPNGTGSIVNGPGTTPAATADSTLSSNLFRGEVLAHLTDPVKRLRPYVGAGLGWRTASLTENASISAFGPGLAGGSLHQSALGALATAGTKLRITKVLSLSFAFDYYLPVARQEARLEQPLAPMNGTSGTSKLSAADNALTGSSQYQILGGVQYAF